jgi:hypothetical protein
MSVSRPYRRTARQLIDGTYTHSGNGRYVLDPRYAKDPEHYVRAYLLLQKDLLELFDYVEPSDQNRDCYSYRIHELLLRACIEVEANCRAVLLENGYKRKRRGQLDMDDYKKIEQSHMLSGYQIRVPTWSGAAGLRTPFSAWGAGGTLTWYQTYNTTKHDRHAAFSQATFEHVLDAVCGCLTILSAQFQHQDFSGQSGSLGIGWPDDGMSDAIGGYFRVKYPQNWPISERYDFSWHILEKDPDPFQQYHYPLT